jgi:hypothetical protein
MASSVPGILPPTFDPFQNNQQSQADGSAEQIPQPTIEEQAEQLQASGQSAGAISVVLGIPLTQVDADLGITAAAAASPATAVLSAISIKA